MSILDALNRRYKQVQGLLNTPMNQGGGLLGNIPQSALLGSAIFGQGVQGKDPFSALLPAVAQTAQLQKLITPKAKKTLDAEKFIQILKQEDNKVFRNLNKISCCYSDRYTGRTN